MRSEAKTERSGSEPERPGPARMPHHAPPAGAHSSPAVPGGAAALSPPRGVVPAARPGGAPPLRLQPAGNRSLAPWPPPPPSPAMERPPLRALLLSAAGLLLLFLPLSSSNSSDTCGPCDQATCPPLPPRGCPLGETRDACGCCPVCARGEGEPCGGGGAGRGHCAPGMECVKSRKRRKGKAGAAAGGPGVSGVCVCKSRYPVCGSDGITYPSGCQLRAASLRAESRGEKTITQVSKGTCEQGGHACFPLGPRPTPARAGGEPRAPWRVRLDRASAVRGTDAGSATPPVGIPGDRWPGRSWQSKGCWRGWATAPLLFFWWFYFESLQRVPGK